MFDSSRSRNACFTFDNPFDPTYICEFVANDAQALWRSTLLERRPARVIYPPQGPYPAMVVMVSDRLSVPDIDLVIVGLEQTAATQRAAFRATESEIPAWRAARAMKARQAAMAEAGLAPKRAKRGVAEPALTACAPVLLLCEPNAEVAGVTDPPAPTEPVPEVSEALAVVQYSGASMPVGGPIHHTRPVHRGCPPGFKADGSRAPDCIWGRKAANNHSMAGYAHAKTCPRSRAWSWAKLGTNAPACRAIVEAWDAAQDQS